MPQQAPRSDQSSATESSPLLGEDRPDSPDVAMRSKTRRQAKLYYRETGNPTSPIMSRITDSADRSGFAPLIQRRRRLVKAKPLPGKPFGEKLKEQLDVVKEAISEGYSVVKRGVVGVFTACFPADGGTDDDSNNEADNPNQAHQEDGPHTGIIGERPTLVLNLSPAFCAGEGALPARSRSVSDASEATIKTPLRVQMFCDAQPTLSHYSSFEDMGLPAPQRTIIEDGEESEGYD